MKASILDIDEGPPESRKEEARTYSESNAFELL
jgi:hypothetical protein